MTRGLSWQLRMAVIAACLAVPSQKTLPVPTISSCRVSRATDEPAVWTGPHPLIRGAVGGGPQQSAHFGPLLWSIFVVTDQGPGLFVPKPSHPPTGLTYPTADLQVVVRRSPLACGLGRWHCHSVSHLAG